jgi:hypothetical protein
MNFPLTAGYISSPARSFRLGRQEHRSFPHPESI